MTTIVYVAIGALAGSAITLGFQALASRRRRQHRHHSKNTTPPIFPPSLVLSMEEERRQRLPETIILLRHGESEANVDKSLWSSIPDNLVGLTDAGKEQARHAGKRISELLNKDPNCQRIMLSVSPFERTLQTAQSLRPYLESKIVRTEIESRIREQEMGNIQSEEFEGYRQEQKRVGRFWYRFPTGESGSDVYDRVKSWWFESVLTVNNRVGYEPVDALIAITHGLTQRFVLMQQFSWSPTTFHSVYNAENCDAYVLRKDLSIPGNSPYRLDVESGDKPRSSIDVRVTFRSDGLAPTTYRLDDYISIPPPRTTRTDLIKDMIAKQYSLSTEDIEGIVLMPFIEGALVRGRTSSRGLGHLSGATVKYHQVTPHVSRSESSISHQPSR